MMEFRYKQNDQSLRYPCPAEKKRIESSGNEIAQSPFTDPNFPKSPSFRFKHVDSELFLSLKASRSPYAHATGI